MSDTLRKLSEFPAMDNQFIEAIGMEMERARRANFLGFGEATPTDVAQQMYAGEGPLFNSMNNVLKYGNPQSKFEDPEYAMQNGVARDMQDRLLEGYTGMGWLPSQIEALGRQPKPKEMSPGGRMAHELSARAKFIQDRDLAAYEKSKTFNPRTWVEGGDPFERLSILKDYGWQALQDAQNPETPVGTFMTKMGNVVADAASHAGDALLGAGNIEDSVGDAAVRSSGADFHRMYPAHVSEDGDWRTRDKLIEDGRRAYAESQGMDANKYIQTFFNNAGIEYYPNPISNMTAGTAVSVGNGFFDGSYGGPRSQIVEELATDGGMGGMLSGYFELPKMGNSDEYLNARPSIAENQQAVQDGNEEQQQAVKVLENINDKIRHPQAEGFESVRSGAQDAIARAIQPVVGAVDQGLTNAQKIAQKAVKSYRAPLGNAIPR